MYKWTGLRSRLPSSCARHYVMSKVVWLVRLLIRRLPSRSAVTSKKEKGVFRENLWADFNVHVAPLRKIL